MKHFTLCFMLAFAASTTFAACPGGCANICDCERPEYRFYFIPGPELTGDYARPYLYSPQTDRWYADPMFYRAQRVSANWNASQGRGQRATAPGMAETPSIEAQMRVVTSRHIPALPRDKGKMKGMAVQADSPSYAGPATDYSIDK